MSLYALPMDIANQRKVMASGSKMVREIREAAQGRVCGGCVHSNGDWCDRHESPVSGGSLRICAIAVACRQWEGT